MQLASLMAQFLPTVCLARVGPGTTFQTASRSNLCFGWSRALTAEVVLGRSLQVGVWDQRSSPAQLFRGAVDFESLGPLIPFFKFLSCISCEISGRFVFFTTTLIIRSPGSDDTHS